MATVTQAQQKRFVGRRQELAALDSTLDGLRGGRARWLVVSGEPGIGKTRLLGELAVRAAARDWITNARFDYFEGEHDGYLRLPAPARHSRSVLFLRGGYWVVRDRVETDGAHHYSLRFHFAPGAAPSPAPGLRRALPVGRHRP